MTQLDEVFSLQALDMALAGHLVVRREHPSQPLAILNYTDRCQYESGHWNEVTMACRGLVYNTQTSEVVARPFRKFFNHGQADAPPLPVDARVAVTDKLDGSLGILYRREVGYAIATRGAFESDQALHATSLWWKRYNDCPVPVGWTLLFEIVYPDNRIVIDYGIQDDLVLLGAVEIATGRSVGPSDPRLSGWPGPRTTLFGYSTLADALTAAPRPNAEGLVVHFIDTDERVKIKQEDYVRLHRIVTGLNERTIWEHLCAGLPLTELLESLPDEFHEWVRDVAARLTATVESQAAEVEHAYSTIVADLPTGFSRKDFALVAVKNPLKWALFAKLDGKAYVPDLWKNSKPAALRGPHGIAPSEDTA